MAHPNTSPPLGTLACLWVLIPDPTRRASATSLVEHCSSRRQDWILLIARWEFFSRTTGTAARRGALVRVPGGPVSGCPGRRPRGTQRPWSRRPVDAPAGHQGDLDGNAAPGDSLGASCAEQAGPPRAARGRGGGLSLRRATLGLGRRRLYRRQEDCFTTAWL